ncbi:MAG TPA: DUF1761 domain-containing protein [Verrucomicrobiae bacterium]|nr:DUF1761 domain-containing protein [Verrucomicrobiae bacterium]
MTPVPINYLAVLACVVWAIILGSLWYGPLFGKPWMQIMGMKKGAMTPEMKRMMAKNYTLMAIGSLVMAFVLAHSTIFAMEYTKTYGLAGGLMSGFWNWIGFVAPVKMGDQLWGGKPWKLFCIDAGYYLVNLLVMGMILAAWH